MKQTRAGNIVRIALRLLGYQLVFGFISFMIMPALMDANPAIRILLAGVIVAAACLFTFLDGTYQGERDVAMSRRLSKLEAKGVYTPDKEENARRYRPMNGVYAMLLGALPLFSISLYVALTAQPYAYTPQDLPSWLGTYMQRAEVGDALAYAGNLSITTTPTDYLRVAVRFMLFGYLGLVGSLSDAGSLLFDRLSPVLALIVPAMFAIGYLFGPVRFARNQKVVDEAKRRPRKRLKKSVREKQAQNREKKQLI